MSCLDFRTLVVALTVTLITAAHSGSAAEPYVPPELEPWRDWVLHDREELNCPGVFAGDSSRRLCLWPEQLELTIEPDGGRFAQAVTVYAETWVALPGDAQAWPQDVTDAGKPLAVVAHDNGPAVKLAPGRHALSGRFEWRQAPKTLTLASATGMLALSVNGDRIERPRWSGNAVWIGNGAARDPGDPKIENATSVTVYRTIFDGAPAYMEVHLQVNISGESREESLGKLLPAGFQPVDMRSILPARLESNGWLRVQARPGNWDIWFRALAPGPLIKLTFSPAGEHWPKDEVWSFAANPSIRVADPVAANPVDPIQAGVPAAARQLPSFRLNAGDTLDIVERRRGPADKDQNRLSMIRTVWMDFGRDGYTVKDQVHGQMVEGWRLDLAGPLALASARSRLPTGEDENLLVTQTPGEEGERGVEIRSPQLNLTTLSRLESAGGTVPVSGWKTSLDGVTTTLNLPPGSRLLRAAGADTDRQSWTNQWNLLDFFLVLLIAVALSRMYAPWVGAVALLMLTLTLHETGAPVWSWLNLTVAFALAKYLPAGGLKTAASVYKALSVIFVVFVALPFAAQQLRVAVFPQLEQGLVVSGYGADVGKDGMVDFVRVEAEKVARRRAVAQETLEEVAVSAAPAASDVSRFDANVSSQRMDQQYSRYDKEARVQTGPGLPNWQWRTYVLAWSGPVLADQTMRLWIAAPWAMSAWRVLMILLLFGLLAVLIRRDPFDLSLPGRPAATAAALLAVVAIVPFGDRQFAAAETPDPRILQELQQRLSKAPDCEPSCVDIARAAVTFDADKLSLQLIAHAQTGSVLEIPGSRNAWHATTIRVDGQAREQVLFENNRYYLALAEGVHRIQLAGAMPNAASVSVAFPRIPRYVTASGSGWEATGITDGVLGGGAITLVRQGNATPRETLDAIDVEQFPVFATVRRFVNFDLEWTVRTEISRITPKTAAITLRVPLLEGESVTSAGVEVEDGVAVVDIAVGERSAGWTSVLERVGGLQLTAPSGKPWQEMWELTTGASWRMEHSGVPETTVDRQGAQRWVASFAPWPGETLSVAIDRPAAVAGPTLAIDSANLVQKVGRRVSDHELALVYRATRGSQHTLTLPPDSELISVTADGRELRVALEDGKLTLPVTPGSHSFDLRWRVNEGNALFLATPAADLGAPASNLAVRTELSNDRWIVWTHGPRLGPAVLYWAELLTFVLLALVLARLVKTPLKFGHWLLLGLGFSTFSWFAFAVVAVFFLGLAWRDRHSIESPPWFNVVQVLLAVLAVGAGLALITAIPYGLLGSPDMGIAGNQSSAGWLNWFVDRSEGPLPAAAVISLPLWIYKALILLWALWLAFALLRWMPWMWAAFGREQLWKRIPRLVSTGTSKQEETPAE